MGRSLGSKETRVQGEVSGFYAEKRPRSSWQSRKNRSGGSHAFRTVEVKSTFGTPCAAAIAFATAAGDEVSLLGDFNARSGSVCSPSMEFMMKKSRTRTLPCSDILSKVANSLRLPHFPTGTTWTSIHGTEHRIDYACFSHKLHEAVSITYILRDQVPCARNGVDHERVVARLQFEKDATSCNVHAAHSRRDKAKRHLSQLIDVSTVHDERCKTEFKRIGKYKCSPGISLES